jgi:cystinosin
MEEWQQIIIDVVGWVYFAAWSLSFYGQIFENFKRKR